MNKTYKPLPECLTIKESEIHGLGLFATEHIPKYTNLGRSHWIIENYGVRRTPLGGFYNHSDYPNCCKEKTDNGYNLITIADIKPGDEITVKYTLYEL